MSNHRLGHGLCPDCPASSSEKQNKKTNKPINPCLLLPEALVNNVCLENIDNIKLAKFIEN
jgi:hypothetical protein